MTEKLREAHRAGYNAGYDDGYGNGGAPNVHAATGEERSWEIARAAIAAMPPAELAAQRSALLNLLAVIHRDGGHKTQEIGWRAAYEQAMELSSERIAAMPPAEFAPASRGPTEAMIAALEASACKMEEIASAMLSAVSTPEGEI